MDSEDDGQRARPPRSLVLAAVLVGAEGLVLGLLGVLELATLDGSRLTLALTTSLFFLALGAGLVLSARGLARVGSWARGPAVAAQLIGLLLSVSFWGRETWPVAVALAVVGLAALTGVLHPASTRALDTDDGD